MKRKTHEETSIETNYEILKEEYETVKRSSDFYEWNTFLPSYVPYNPNLPSEWKLKYMKSTEMCKRISHLCKPNTPAQVFDMFRWLWGACHGISVHWNLLKKHIPIPGIQEIIINHLSIVPWIIFCREEWLQKIYYVHFHWEPEEEDEDEEQDEDYCSVCGLHNTFHLSPCIPYSE